MPVVPIDCAGFYGTKNLGNRIGGDAMVKYVIGTREPDPRSGGICVPPGVRFMMSTSSASTTSPANFGTVLPLFDELGLRILCTLSGDARFREVQTMHRAEVNMMVCSKALLNVARKLEEKYGTPWFEGSFYGVADTSQAFRDFARLLDDPDLTERHRGDRLPAKRRGSTRPSSPGGKRLRDKRILLYTGGVKSWSMISALQDLGLTVVATGTNKSTEEDKARIRELMGADVKMIDDGSPQALLKVPCSEYAGRHPHRRRSEHLHRPEGQLPFLDINQERDFGYAGYEGMLELARQLARTLESPVWEAVRPVTPWEPALTARKRA